MVSKWILSVGHIFIKKSYTTEQATTCSPLMVRFGCMATIKSLKITFKLQLNSGCRKEVSVLRGTVKLKLATAISLWLCYCCEFCFYLHTSPLWYLNGTNEIFIHHITAHSYRQRCKFYQWIHNLQHNKSWFETPSLKSQRCNELLSSVNDSLVSYLVLSTMIFLLRAFLSRLSVWSRLRWNPALMMCEWTCKIGITLGAVS